MRVSHLTVQMVYTRLFTASIYVYIYIYIYIYIVTFLENDKQLLLVSKRSEGSCNAWNEAVTIHD